MSNCINCIYFKYKYKTQSKNSEVIFKNYICENIRSVNKDKRLFIMTDQLRAEEITNFKNLKCNDIKEKTPN